MSKIMHIVGARPQFIKMAPLYNALENSVEQITVHTGQHYDFEMSDLFFDELKIHEPDYNLEVGSGTHGSQTADIILHLEKVLMNENPDMVIIYGDTNSTLGASLTCGKLYYPIVHVEAGVRSGNMHMPEEINRIVTDKLSSILFTPMKSSVENLKNEGISEGVYNTGDIMYDILKNNLTQIEHRKRFLEQLSIKENEYILATVHREINTDKEGLCKIVDAFSKINEVIIFPIHPRTKKMLVKYNLLHKLIGKRNIKLISPVGYLEMLILEKFARIIVTDSGGIQKEAYIIGVPCITLRNETEWKETVRDGWNILVGNDKEKIIDSINSFHPKGRRKNIFGDGNSALTMKGIIIEYLNEQ
jgi:UDP-N-acetylglucosamine 2-epimerase (non-hydrolysing)